VNKNQEPIANSISANRVQNCQLDSVRNLIEDSQNKPKKFMCANHLNPSGQLPRSEQLQSSSNIVKCMDQSDLAKDKSILEQYKQIKRDSSQTKPNVISLGMAPISRASLRETAALKNKTKFNPILQDWKDHHNLF